MDPMTSHLDQTFGSFPEPVLLLDGDQVIYANEPGQALLQEEAFPAELLAALAEHPGSAMETALGEAFYRVTVSPYDVGMLVVLRPLPPAEEKRHPFSNAVYRMRECLSNFTAVQFRMKRVLQEHHLLGGLEQDLANQSRLIYQMLRLTRQAELTQELNDKAFPREEGFDLAMVCQGMADEATWLADLAGVRFTYTSNVEHLPFQGSKSLLTQMLLALVSNGVRAAGKDGAVEMKLHAENGRCVISLRDTGVGIPEDRMATLFSGDAPEELPRPGEGAGLGLYNAQRIAALHGGVLVAQSGQDGGTCLVASLPIVVPTSVPARNNRGMTTWGATPRCSLSSATCSLGRPLCPRRTRNNEAIGKTIPRPERPDGGLFFVFVRAGRTNCGHGFGVFCWFSCAWEGKSVAKFRGNPVGNLWENAAIHPENQD